MLDMILLIANLFIIGTGHKILTFEEQKDQPNTTKENLAKVLLVIGLIVTIYLTTRVPAVFL